MTGLTMAMSSRSPKNKRTVTTATMARAATTTSSKRTHSHVTVDHHDRRQGVVWDSANSPGEEWEG
jgi:hypothetical protein